MNPNVDFHSTEQRLNLQMDEGTRWRLHLYDRDYRHIQKLIIQLYPNPSQLHGKIPIHNFSIEIHPQTRTGIITNCDKLQFCLI